MFRERERARIFSNYMPKSSSGFSPASLGDALEMWIDPADASTISHVSNSVSRIDDKSGNARHFVQTDGARQPVTNVQNISGTNVLNYNGGHWMDVIDTAPLPLPADCTVFIVQSLEGTTFNHFHTFGNTAFFAIGEDGAVAGGPAVNSGTVSYFRDGEPLTILTRGDCFDEYITGPNVAVFDNVSFAATGIWTSMRFGALRSMAGKIGDIIIAHDITLAQKNQIGIYLQTKYGITWTAMT